MHNTINCASMQNYFVLALNISEKTKAKITAAAIPPAVASSPPVNAPKSPLACAPEIAPLAKDAPKPMIGTLMPALANSEIGAKTLKACKIMPISTKVTSMRAEVMFV